MKTHPDCNAYNLATVLLQVESFVAANIAFYGNFWLVFSNLVSMC